MPVITCVLIEGYSEETRRYLEERLSDAARLAIGAAWDGITVMINELPAANYMRKRGEIIPAIAPHPPAGIVRNYLSAMEARDLDTAKGYLADDFVMTFPGDVQFQKPEELVEWSKDRYKSVSKKYEFFDEAVNADNIIVYCSGTLSGIGLDGEPFSGIRFIDRFAIQDNKISRQWVWNDLAESMK
jgi:phenylpyruvate tautomerase PptA (4-oxalocrotonate tautomerase family)